MTSPKETTEPLSEIHIRLLDGETETYQAYCYVPLEWAELLMSADGRIKGRSSGGGPWVEGKAMSIQGATNRLLCTLGSLLLEVESARRDRKQSALMAAVDALRVEVPVDGELAMFHWKTDPSQPLGGSWRQVVAKTGGVQKQVPEATVRPA
jgi:hypothetical protein